MTGLNLKLILAVAVFVQAVSVTSASWRDGYLGHNVTLTLTDGREVNGRVLAWDDDRVVLAAEEGEAEYRSDDVSRVKRGPDEESKAADIAAREVWEAEVQKVRTARTALAVIGVAGAVGGTVMYLDGYKENQSAGDVPGCTRSGSNVFCIDEDSRAEAQRRIDRGDRGMLTGAIVLAVGSLSILGALMQNNRLRALETEGRRKGFHLESHRGRDLHLVYRYAF